MLRSLTQDSKWTRLQLLMQVINHGHKVRQLACLCCSPGMLTRDKLEQSVIGTHNSEDKARHTQTLGEGQAMLKGAVSVLTPKGALECMLPCTCSVRKPCRNKPVWMELTCAART